MKRIFGVLVLAALMIAVPALADDVSDAIEEGMKAYEAKDYGTAAAQWEYAATLAKKMKAGDIGDALPAPLDGWTQGKTEEQAYGGAFMGGGVSAQRSYTRGDERVEIQIMMDSPMIQSFGMLYSNPSMAVMSGMDVVKVKGQQAFGEQEDNGYELSFLLDGKILVQINGRGGAESSKNNVMAYAEKIDYDALKDI